MPFECALCPFFELSVKNSNNPTFQVQLYEDFAKSRAKKNLDVTVGKAMKADFEINEKKQGSTHIFQVINLFLSCIFIRFRCFFVYSIFLITNYFASWQLMSWRERTRKMSYFN